jgi:GNAT superfamily N-acetyltransferase
MVEAGMVEAGRDETGRDDGRILIGPVSALVANAASVPGLQIAAFSSANFVGLAECLLAASPTESDICDLTTAKARIKDTLKGSRGRVLPGVSPTGLLAGEVVGALQIVERSPLAPKIELPMVIALFVHPEQLGIGLAATLLGHAAARLELGGFEQLAVHLDEQTPAEAVAVFTQSGFTDLAPMVEPA